MLIVVVTGGCACSDVCAAAIAGAAEAVASNALTMTKKGRSNRNATLIVAPLKTTLGVLVVALHSSRKQSYGNTTPKSLHTNDINLERVVSSVGRTTLLMTERLVYFSLFMYTEHFE